MPASPKPLIVGGGYEFPIPGSTEHSPDTVAKLKIAYTLLGYDIFFLAHRDLQSLGQNGVTADPSWRGPLAEPEVVSKTVDGGQIAFVLLPDSGHDDPLLDARVGGFVRDLRQSGKFNLIVGVSTWGSEREMRLINAEADTFDIVLGSGDGPGYAGLYLQDNKVLWVRTFPKGKGVNVISIPTLPAPGTKIVWEPETTISTKAESMGDTIPLDPAIAGLFAP